MRNKLLSIMALLIVSLLALPLVSALNSGAFTWEVDVNGDEAEVGILSGEEVYVDTDGSGVLEAGEINANNTVSTVSVEEGQTVEVEVTLATGDLGAEEYVNDIEVEAKIKGYEYSRNEPMSDSTKLFDMKENTQKTVRLHVDLPRNLEKREYWLRLSIDADNTASVERIVKLNVEPTRHGVDIADVTFSPGNTVKAGRSLLATVLLENFGDKEEEDVKVTVTMPALGITASEYVDAVKTDDNNVDFEDVPEMFLAIPATAEAGDYDVVVKAEYDRFEEVVETYTVHVLANEMFTGDETTLVLAVGPENQNIQAGKAGRYAVALTNAGVKSRAYLLSAVAGQWATVSLSDSLVVLEPGKNKVVYVDVAAAQDATQGMQTVALTISANNEELETVSLGANVVAPTVAAPAAQTLNLRNGLEIALIVLVVILVIIGLIIGFSRLRKDEGDEEKAYY